MSVSGWEQLLFIVAVTAVLAPLLGRYLAATFRGTGASGNSAAGSTAPGDRVFLPIERQVYRILGVDPESSWTWRAYALAVLVFGAIRMNAVESQQPAGRMRVAMVQGNIPQSIKWDPAFLDTSFNVYLDQTQQAARHHVDLVVWPEAAAAFFFQPTALYPPRFAGDAV